MDESKRATIYLDAEVHRALRLKAAATNRSMSEMVNEAVRMALAEDAVDLAVVGQRVAESSVSFEAFVQDLHDRGRI
ncbi:MAG: ribbon-helix-helix domain-containing protein [Trueperaceae bacterium]|nr:ribbon-helix-helix domain-containing protein [Trueperaceae bacterium]